MCIRDRYKKSKALIAMGMPMSVLNEDKIFDKIISIKYDVPNDRLDMFDDYKKQIDAFYENVLERKDVYKRQPVRR